MRLNDYSHWETDDTGIKFVLHSDPGCIKAGVQITDQDYIELSKLDNDALEAVMPHLEHPAWKEANKTMLVKEEDGTYWIERRSSYSCD